METTLVNTIVALVPVILLVAFIVLIIKRRRDGLLIFGEGGMGQIVGELVVLFAALTIMFAFVGGMGGGDDHGPGPEPPSPTTYTVSFYVASDSTGYGTVSQATLRNVPSGTPVTVAQTLEIGEIGQCTATPTATTSDYSYAFSGWTGANNSSTAAPTTITRNTSYYAHFTRTEVPLEPMDPTLFTYTVADDKATVTGWASTPPANGYDLYFPSTDGDGHTVTAVAAGQFNVTSIWAGARSVMGDTIQTVGQYAFEEAALLTTVSLPAATSIGMYAFVDCSALESVNAPQVTDVGPSAFRRCTSLETVNLVAATTIGSYAFDGDLNLASVNLPAATTIAEWAFDDCSGLESILMPASTSIGSEAFRLCTGVSTVTFGPLTYVDTDSFPSWTFYGTNGTTVLSKTAANLASSTFQGEAAALIKVRAGQQAISKEMMALSAELASENRLKAAMLAELDPELVDMDLGDVAVLTAAEIRALDADGLSEMKKGVRSVKYAALASIDEELAEMPAKSVERLTLADIHDLTPSDVAKMKQSMREQKESGGA